MEKNSGKTILIVAFAVLAITLIASTAALITIFSNKDDNKKTVAEPTQTTEFEAPPTVTSSANTPIITPSPVATASPTAPPKSESLYRVRKSLNDSSSQKGAFENVDNAIKEANKYPGYSVYAPDGSIIYTSPNQSSTSNSEVKYRVRKSAGDSSSQIGAFANYDKAVSTAESNPGYKVYDMSGNLIYAP